ncbi:MAG: sucrase ferredoxin [Chloroflexota bacterium]
MDDHFCSIVSQELAEPIYGQALTADVWLLLEYNRPWGSKATAENELPLDVQAWLEGVATAVPHSRLQFIRQLPDAHLTFFVAVVDKDAPRLYRFALDRYEALFELDVPAVVAGAAHYAPYLWTEPLFLVCTNGKRDQCCALFGAAVYRELQAEVGRAAWQTTHVGGHRYAPNVLTFPDGTFYSRMQVADVPELVTAVQQQQIALPFYRGRTCYQEPEQAADYFLRRETGQTQLSFFRHVATVPTGDDVSVRFVDAVGGQHEVVVGRETAVLPGLLASCGKPQQKPVTQYTFIRYRSLSM